MRVQTNFESSIVYESYGERQKQIATATKNIKNPAIVSNHYAMKEDCILFLNKKQLKNFIK